MIPFNDIQKQHKEAIKWLLDPKLNHKAKGRTFLMAACFIELAIENPGKAIHLFDHDPSYRNMIYLYEIISNLARQYFPQYEYKLNLTNQTLKMEKRNALSLSGV
jgi:hypothetical protein